MFAKACKQAGGFTRPVVTMKRFFDGSTESGCGAFIVINADGWALTAAHLFFARDTLQRHARNITDYFMRIHTIQQDPRLSDGQKHRRIFRLKANPRWITSHAFWWGGDGVELRDVRALPEGDLALGRLDPFDPEAFPAYPVFKDPERLDAGTSLCRLGYPFHRVEAVFDEGSGTFILSPGSLSLVLFPIEGIYTRTLSAGMSRDGKYPIKSLETSSPGLTGQSGGPIVDARGTVWAVQSRTEIHAIGSYAGTGTDGRAVSESQFINLGVGVHPELIMAFLKDNGVAFAVSDY
jgi:hypothetical protein